MDIEARAIVVAREFGIGFSHTQRLKQQTQVNTFFVSHVIVSNCITLNGQEYYSVRVHAASPVTPRSARQNSHLLHHRLTSPYIRGHQKSRDTLSIVRSRPWCPPSFPL